MINGMENARYIAATILKDSNLEGEKYYEKEDELTETIEECLKKIHEQGVYNRGDLEHMKLSQEYIDEIFKLPNDEKYIVVEDYQEGTFGMFRFYGVRDWYCQMLNYDFDSSSSDEEWESHTLDLEVKDYGDILDEFEEIYSVKLERLEKVVKFYNQRHNKKITVDNMKDDEVYLDVVNFWCEHQPKRY